MHQPLRLAVSNLPAVDGVVGNIEAACRLGLDEFQPAICFHDGTFVIVGSGPSLADFADEIRAEQAKGRPICAVKGAHDWLMEQGITPDLFFSIEPRDRRNNVKLKNKRTLYVLASRCDPVMFSHLSDCNVMLVHCLSSPEENQWFEGKKKTMIGGVSTSGLRAVNLGYGAGFRKFLLFGMDSCNAPDGVTKRVDGSLSGQTMEIAVGFGGRRFVCNMAMAKQAEDFQKLYTILPNLEIESRGDGLITAIIADRNRRRAEREAKGE